MCSLTGYIITLFTHPNNYPSQPKSMRPFSGFLAIGIFAIHKTWTLLAFWWRIDDKTGTLAYSVWCIVWVVQTQLFAENSNRGRKVSPEKLKSSHSRRFLLEKSKNSKNSKSRKVHIPGDFCSKSRKIRKVEKFEKFEKFEKSKSSHSRRFRLEKSKKSKKSKNRKVEKSKSSKKSKNSKSRKVENFLTFCEKFCNFRAVRLPARRALSIPPPWDKHGQSISSAKAKIDEHERVGGILQRMDREVPWICRAIADS